VGWTPSQGREVHGRVVRTYVRGVLAFDGDSVTATAGTGRFVAPG
jgi:dihydroorotase-like cyclic amidohydrolase